MARPIKETPILFGEDARRFEARMRENHKASPEEKARILKNYRLGLEMIERGKKLRAQGFKFSAEEM